MDPNIGKATGKERTVTPCNESLPTSCGPHRKRFLEVQTEIHSHMVSDKNTFLQEETVSAKRKLMSVGGCADTPLDLVATGNSDGKHPCLGDGQTVLMRTPTQTEFVECWSEVIIRNGLPPALVDDPLFRKAHNFSHGPNSRVHGQGNCSWKEGHDFASSHFVFRKKNCPQPHKLVGATRLQLSAGGKVNKRARAKQMDMFVHGTGMICVLLVCFFIVYFKE